MLSEVVCPYMWYSRPALDNRHLPISGILLWTIRKETRKHVGLLEQDCINEARLRGRREQQSACPVKSQVCVQESCLGNVYKM